MASSPSIRKSGVPGKVPSVSDLQPGDIGVNYYDGRIYIRRNKNSNKVVAVGGDDYASTDNPIFTGTPTAPTAAPDTASSQIATTEFVVNQAGNSTPLTSNIGNPGVSFRYSREDHIHPTDLTRAPIVSPIFSGIPSAPTPAPGVATSQIATTEFVSTAINDKSFSFTGDVTGSGTSPVNLSLVSTGVTAGTYNTATTICAFTVDIKGRITSIGNPTTITPAFSSITGKPTTLAGYGITDAAEAIHDHLGLLHRDSTVLDFDAALTEGTYGINSSITLDGAPYTGSIYGKLICIVNTGATHNNSNNWIWQLFTDTSGRVYSRRKINANSWSSWSHESTENTWEGHVRFNFKKNVYYATSANITLSGTQTLDSIILTGGQRVLVKHQSNATQNGIYTVQLGAWTRTPDAATSSDLAGATVFVERGPYAGQLWTTTFQPSYTLNSTAVDWFSIQTDNGANVTANAFVPSGSVVPPQGMFLPAANTLGFVTNSTEKARLTSTGQVLLGTIVDPYTYPTTDSFSFATTQTAKVQLIGQQPGNVSTVYALYNTIANARFGIDLSRSKSATIGLFSAVTAGDCLGSYGFNGDDGSDFASAAALLAYVDGSVTTDSVPGRISLRTTTTGQTAPTEKWRLTNGGIMCSFQSAPTTKNATATLTIDEIKTGIITSNPTTANITLTLPLGTDTDSGFSSLATNLAFDWSIINTNATYTVSLAASATGHTLNGSGLISTNNSALFRTRRSGSNSFVTYRIS